MRANLALQAALCYTEATHIVVAGGATNTPARIHSWRNVPMTTLPPHVPDGNLIPATSGIYKITCTANKRIYIGSAINLQSRKRQHFSDLHLNKHSNPILQNAWNKYGEQTFTFDVLEQVLPISLTAREQYWFNKLKPFGRKGFNIDRDAGSRLGNKHSPETLEKMSLSHIGKRLPPEQIEKIRLANTGKKRLPESIVRMSQAKLGKKYSPVARQKMSQAKLGNTYQLGKKRSPEARAKMSQSALARKHSPHSPEAIENIRQAKLGHEVSPETREKLRQASLAAWQRKRSNEHA